MTKTHQLLNLMATGKPVTYDDIMACTGWTLAQTQTVVHFVMTSGYIMPLVHEYAITQAGRARQQFKPKTAADKIARSPEASKIKREAAAARKIKRESEASKTETMIQTSVRTNANSVFNLGDKA